MARRKTDEEFIKEVYELVGGEYEFLDKYVNGRTKIKCKHNTDDCGNIYEVVPASFLGGRRCPKCAKKSKRLTNNEFVKKVYDLVQEEYEFIEKYHDSKTKLMCRHNTCGHIWSITPNSFLSGKSKCPKCSRKKTNEEFISEILSLVGDDYIFLEEYIDAQTKIKCKHNECGYIWSVYPSNFLQGRRCPKCANSKSNEIFKREVHDLVGDEYEFLEEYKNSKVRIKCRHNKCGHIYKVQPNGFLQGNRCPKCSRAYTNDYFLSEVQRVVGDEYVFLEKYRGSDKGIKVKHRYCGYEYVVVPSQFLSKGTRCPQCTNSIPWTDNYFKQKIHSIVGMEYEFLEKYIDSQTKIKCKHNTCNHTWKVKPNSFLNGTRCPVCARTMPSRGEFKIKEVLNSSNTDFICEYRLDDCKNNKPLPFDFYLPNHNLLIEYDGVQHFKPVDFAGKGEEWANERFEYVQQNDKIKNQYCKDNGIPLLRIPYWEFDNIEGLLKQWLTKYSVLKKCN